MQLPDVRRARGDRLRQVVLVDDVASVGLLAPTDHEAERKRCPQIVPEASDVAVDISDVPVRVLLDDRVARGPDEVTAVVEHQQVPARRARVSIRSEKSTPTTS